MSFSDLFAVVLLVLSVPAGTFLALQEGPGPHRWARLIEEALWRVALGGGALILAVFAWADRLTAPFDPIVLLPVAVLLIEVTAGGSGLLAPRQDD